MKLKQLTGYLRDKTKKKCEIKWLTQLDGSVYFLHKMGRGSIKLEIQYVTYHRIPGGDILDGMLRLHTTIFGKSYDLVSRMEEKSGLIIDLALNHQQIVGYKIGYALNSNQFYSWLGGVEDDYKRQGIASKLMERQHRLLKEKGYNVVRTHTKNKWRAILLLNIQSGFDIIGIYTDKEGEAKIILEKEL